MTCERMGSPAPRASQLSSSAEKPSSRSGGRVGGRVAGRVAREAQHSSRNAFFDHRADTVEVKDLFRSDKVTEFSCTLDKVTVQHRSFTVLFTFFFINGKIFCLLNILIAMKEDKYNVSGTAKMVVFSCNTTIQQLC